MHKSQTRFFSTAAKTYKFEQIWSHNHLNLPRLPIPKLEDTVEKYLETMEPLLSEKDFHKQQQLVNDFAKTKGPELHEKLLNIDADYAKSGKYPFYYFEDIWDDGYLGARCNSPININPILIVNKPSPTNKPQTVIAARFINGFLAWVEKLKSGEMAPDNPQADMSQFMQQVGVARLPGHKRDTLHQFPDSKHIVVIHDGKYFKVPVISEQGVHVSPTALQACFDDICQNFKQAPKCQIGLLTADERTQWAENREKIVALPVNKYAIETVDSAIIVVCLEKKAPTDHSELNRLILSEPENRWYDKHQVIVTSNGVVGVNFEHSFSDGLTWVRWITESWTKAMNLKNPYGDLPACPETNEKPEVKLLEWDLNPLVREAIETSGNAYRQLESTLDLRSILYSNINRDILKKWKVGPDGVVQAAYQLAHIRAYGFSPPTYESCSTRAFFHGRTETIRSASVENKKFSLAMDDKSVDNQTRWKLLQDSVARHIRVATQCAQGLGVDRHLLALKCLGSHPLFEDADFNRGRSWRLSTSNLTSPNISFFGFGPVIPEGFGIGYSILDEGVQMQLTNWNNCPTTNGKKFGEALVDSFDSIYRLGQQIF